MDEAMLSSVLHEAKENRMVLSFMNDEFIEYKERMEKRRERRENSCEICYMSFSMRVCACVYACMDAKYLCLLNKVIHIFIPKNKILR